MPGDKPVKRRGSSFAVILSCCGCALWGSAGYEARAESAEPAQAEMIPQDDVVVRSGASGTNQPVTYSLRIYKNRDRFKLKGNMSSEEDYKTLLGLLKASFPSAGVTDRIEVKESATDSDVKIGGLSFALKLLGYLDKGQATVDDNGLTLEGAASTAVVLNEVRKLIDNDRPTGVPLKNIRIAPPQKSWTISLTDNGTLKITGVVPDEAKKQAIAAAASKTLPECNIDDSTSVNSSIPDKWVDAAHHSLSILKVLSRGSVEITEDTIQLKGAAPNEVALKTIERLASEMPAGFSVHSEVTAPTRPGVAAIAVDELAPQ
jgi:hypothetical protein